jgi:nucleoside-diphosphate-sugar epimerase
MKRVLVTGGSGKLGRVCVRDLVEHGLEVFNADTVSPKETLCPFRQVDFEDMAQTIEIISAMDFDHRRSVDAIVHLAAMPTPGRVPNETVVRINTMSTYNIFEAARRLGIKNIVWASSETVLGIPFDQPPPYFPLDEEYAARPETGYSLSKYLGEVMAEQFCRWDLDLKIASLRFSNVMEPWEYASFPDFEKHPASRRWNMWGYIDVRDGAQAVRKALEAPFKGAQVFFIGNADTVMSRPNKDLVAEFYPNVQFKKEVGPNDTLLSIDKARRMIGYKPEHSWRHQNNK